MKFFIGVTDDNWFRFLAARRPVEINFFREKNGADTYDGFYRSVMAYNRRDEINPDIGCTILTEPFFFDRDDWIPVSTSWSPNLPGGLL